MSAYICSLRLIVTRLVFFILFYRAISGLCMLKETWFSRQFQGRNERAVLQFLGSNLSVIHDIFDDVGNEHFLPFYVDFCLLYFDCVHFQNHFRTPVFSGNRQIILGQISNYSLLKCVRLDDDFLTPSFPSHYI